MPANDSIDNRDQKPVDPINCILGSTEAAKFAVGYFFLSGLEAVAGQLAGVSNMRILIGNTSNRETSEQIAEGSPQHHSPLSLSYCIDLICPISADGKHHEQHPFLPQRHRVSKE
jgi:hypothetical protein